MEPALLQSTDKELHAWVGLEHEHIAFKQGRSSTSAPTYPFEGREFDLLLKCISTQVRFLLMALNPFFVFMRLLKSDGRGP